jgi:hypothetical protein
MTIRPNDNAESARRGTPFTFSGSLAIDEYRHRVLRGIVFRRFAAMFDRDGGRIEAAGHDFSASLRESESESEVD